MAGADPSGSASTLRASVGEACMRNSLVPALKRDPRSRTEARDWSYRVRMPVGSENAPASWNRSIPSDTGVRVMVARRSGQRIERLTLNCGTTAEARVAHWRIGNQFFDLDVDAFVKDVRGGIETVQQVMHHVAGDYVFSSTGRIVTTGVLRDVAIPPARVPIRGSLEAIAA